MSQENKGSFGPRYIVTSEPDRSGNYICNGVNDEVDIQQALDDLTAGRTRKEKVLLKGSFTIEATIEVPSYTILQLDGRVDLAADDIMLTNDNIGGGNTEIEIRGGEWDGNDQQATNGNHMFHFQNVDNGLIADTYLHDCEQDLTVPIYIRDCDNFHCERVTLRDGFHGGIWVEYCRDCDQIECMAYNTPYDDANGSGAFLVSSFNGATYRCDIINCKVNICQNWGFQIYGGNSNCYDCWIRGGEVINSGVAGQNGANINHGNFDDTCVGCGIIGTSFRQENDAAGFAISLGGDHIIVRDCHIDYWWLGINLADACDHDSITGCHIQNCDRGIRIQNGAEHNWIDDCYIEATNGDGIEIEAGANNNIIGENNDFGTCSAERLDDDGTGTQMPTRSTPFIEPMGTGVWDTGLPAGIEINTSGEGAVAMDVTPPKLHEIKRIIIWAVALAAPGAGNKMRLEISFRSGLSDESYAGESVVIANHPSNETNFDVNDIISWTIDPTDDVDIGQVQARECFQCRLKYEAAGNGDIATEILARCAEIHYV